MITNIRRELRLLQRAAPSPHAILDRLREVETALDTPDDQEYEHFVEILCDSIKLKQVELSILALRSLKRHIESPQVTAKSLQSITESVTKIEFKSTESELVEEGYHQAVRLCCSMVKCRASHELTNCSISEIIIFCFRVVNSRLSKWLRSKAARTLLAITKIIFKRLHEFPEDPLLKPSYQIRLRLGGASSQSTFKELADQSLASDNASHNGSTASSLRIITERNQPYNLAFYNDFFCYLASLISPDHDSNELTKAQEDRILLGLNLLKAVFAEAGSSIGQKSCLIYITRNNVCYNIVSLLKTNQSPHIVYNTLNLAVDIFVELRRHLKYQFEAFIERLMEMLVTNTELMSPDTSLSSLTSSSQFSNNIELRSDVLNAVLDLFRNIEYLAYELYYNYDCDPHSSNIYENLVQICSKNCFQHCFATHFMPNQLTPFKCLLKNMADIYRVESGAADCPNNMIPAGDLYKTANHFSRGSIQATALCETPNDLNSRLSKFPRTYADLTEAKKRKRLLWLALDKFNSRPKDGIAFIRDNKLIDDDMELVEFFKDNLRVDKKSLGEFLSDKDNKQVREAFIRSLDFANLRIDEALRSMLEKFRLPGESQLIERILDSFSQHWFEQNKGVLRDSDEALSLAYAIIMLNVDQHSKKVKQTSQPMTVDQFDRNLLGPKSDRIYDRKLVEQIFTNIRDNEIVLPGEQVGAVRQRYLWKCIMVKSERLNAIYWTTGKTESATEHQLDMPVPIPPPPPPFVSQLPGALVLEIGDPAEVAGAAAAAQEPKQLILIDMNKILFEIMWSPTAAALSFIFDKIDTSVYPGLSRRIVDEGFIRFAHLCARHGHLDNLVVSLCKFTADTNAVPHQHAGHQRNQFLSDKNSLAALSLLSIIRDYGNCMRESWSNIVRNILHWYCSKCIDDVVQVDDFALQRKLRLRMREIKKSPSTMNAQSSTFLRSVYTYFAGQSTGDESQPAQQQLNGATDKRYGSNASLSGPIDATGLSAGGEDADKDAMKSTNGSASNVSAPSAVQVLIQTIQDAEYCKESLIELIAALNTVTVDGDPEEVEDAEVFKLEIFTQVILNNKDQALCVWPRIRAYFARQSSFCGRSLWLGERIISAAFRVAIQFKPKPEVFSLLGHILKTLDADIVRGDHTFVALMTLTELQATTVSMNVQELEACFEQVIFPFMEKVLDGCDPVQSDRKLNRAINLLSKIFLKHHKVLKELQTFALLWYAILDIMEKYIKANGTLKEATFELVKNMVLVMDNEQCMSVEMKDITRTKFMFWEFQSGSDY